ncbi:hypothetical protein WOLCODRAFT_156542 [Wolfiporia cocos MD-104 SS10]|uniref:Uncharacterized protein n=1 Tax=Wolfiporia cocos (strain MD-104) TaxID=742152 RepID=A0A2H3JDU2_WOLCO|nr:hypothetical protein WOLCODRAFT_156542 [Wolfiporia cocos MD-104 SS10]
MTTFDYSPFGPGRIESALLDLSKAYEETVQACNKAYQLIPLPGLSTREPSVPETSSFNPPSITCPPCGKTRIADESNELRHIDAIRGTSVPEMHL